MIYQLIVHCLILGFKMLTLSGQDFEEEDDYELSGGAAGGGSTPNGMTSFLVAKLLYNSLCLSVRQSIIDRPLFFVIFSAAIEDMLLLFFVMIPLSKQYPVYNLLCQGSCNKRLVNIYNEGFVIFFIILIIFYYDVIFLFLPSL